MKVRLMGAVATFTVITAIAGFALASSNGANGPGNVVLVYNGPSVANTHASPSIPAFTTWCTTNGPCTPSVTMPAVDASSGAVVGQLYVWTKNFVSSADGKSTCFGEFAWFALRDGDVYANSGGNGTCGAAIDGTLKAPTHIAGPGAVLAGGGDGTIVGGTGRYAKWTGTYADRVFVEVSYTGAPNYYDQLFWSLNGD